ncbi:MAG: sensor histidine kinase [Burkholderiaceae bacterium]|nr:sensor histidine kinase [Microbacteriaceae bacterium]
MAFDSTASVRQRPRPSPRGYRSDALVAVALFLGTLLSAWLYARISMGEGVAEPWVVVGWAAIITLSLAARRRAPEIVAIVISVTFILMMPLQVPELLFSNICLFLGMYSVGAWSTNRRRATWIRALIVIGMFTWLFGTLYTSSLDPDALPQLSRLGTISPYAAFGLIQIIISLLYFGAAWYFGNSAFAAARERAALRQRTLELAEERELSAAQAVALERVRIARELHDVVAHHVSVMGVQAGAARRIVDRDPAGAAASLSAIETSARSAIDDLHRMLGTLRDDSAGGAPALESSTRGVEQLDDLVADSVASGVPCDLVVVGDPRPVPLTVGLSIYRIAQEALTNTRKHGGTGVTAEVRLRYRPNAIELEATDTGVASRTAQQASTAGLGQVGMRERVAATGGELELGPRPRGGYLVRAIFPLAPVDAPFVSLEHAP